MDKSNAIMETFEAKKKEVADNINKNIEKLEKDLGTKINAKLADKKIDQKVEKEFSMTNYIPHLVLIGILIICIILVFVYMEEISKLLGLNKASNILPADYVSSYKNN